MDFVRNRIVLVLENVLYVNPAGVDVELIFQRTEPMGSLCFSGGINFWVNHLVFPCVRHGETIRDADA